MAIQPSRSDSDRVAQAEEEDGDTAALRDLRRQSRAARPLETGELAELLKRSATGDRASHDRVVAGNLAMVIRLAEARTERGLSLLDLIQEGSLGLLEAVRTFAETGPARFAAFAEAHVAGQMEAAIAAEAAAVRDVQLLVEAATDYERVDLLLHRELKRVPTERDIADKLEWTVERTRYVAQVVVEARRRHDEELLAFIDPDAVDLDDDERGELDA
jgi:DNA-directed RNA polymerase sigma subunit (sigma70/sigma32)